MYRFNELEEKIMKSLWKLEKGFPKEIIHDAKLEEYPYNTVLSTIRKLENEGAITYRMIGKSHQYYPKIKERDYSGKIITKVFKDFFSGSAEQFLSFFMEKEKISIEELEKHVKKLKQKKNKH
jgi:BlaI family transcriptional regulator, penicillinase repressor